MKIKILQETPGADIGEIRDVPDIIADELVNKGQAEMLTSLSQPVVKQTYIKK